MIIKHIHGVNLIKTYVFHVINNQTWVWKLDTLATHVISHASNIN
jgi:hypothetical protein